MARQKPAAGPKHRKASTPASQIDDGYDPTAVTPADFDGFLDPLLDGSAIFDELFFWVDSTDTSRNRINGDDAPMASLHHISGNLALAGAYPHGLDRLSTAMPDFLSSASSTDQPTEADQGGAGGGGKNRCWDHGCNGREFSSKSNFVRHVKERAGTSAKGVCPLCGAVFTRNSARDTHLAKQSCNRIRRYSNGRPRPSRLAVLGNPRVTAAAVAATDDVHWQAVDWGSGYVDGTSATMPPPPT
ncbi:hypothetical protein GGS23DRAFT_596798 [Durotheca rogersii]|uniref:uncharacterized protein n=1 Tax=Durotheca rogersii TaxID=419775 RepID=UPI002220655F|nr:uncharacterized protein GGS23DRAFT_596798 [Durotheca rogersii]KAI5863028.1 hypothetical protein GGS23DRAFT_596798 [Durotheca rogersii]